MEGILEYRRLGRTGLMVSELCLGCMTFGREMDEEGSRGVISRYLDAGGNFIDTADVYESGASEEITGRALRDVPRADYVLATKVRFPMGEEPNDVGLAQARGSGLRGDPPAPQSGAHRSLPGPHLILTATTGLRFRAMLDGGEVEVRLA